MFLWRALKTKDIVAALKTLQKEPAPKPKPEVKPAKKPTLKTAS